jgi:hypothetical protein
MSAQPHANASAAAAASFKSASVQEFGVADRGMLGRFSLFTGDRNDGGFNHGICGALYMSELERGRIFQAIPKHPVHADMGDPDQAYFPEQSAMKQCSEDT